MAIEGGVVADAEAAELGVGGTVTTGSVDTGGAEAVTGAGGTASAVATGTTASSGAAGGTGSVWQANNEIAETATAATAMRPCPPRATLQKGHEVSPTRM